MPNKLQRILGEDELLNRVSFNEVFVNDAFHHLGSCLVVPHAFGIDDRDRPLLTDSQAVRLCTINTGLSPLEAQFRKSFLQETPRLIGFIPRCAFWRRLVCTKKNMTLDTADSECSGNLVQGINRRHIIFHRGILAGGWSRQIRRFFWQINPGERMSNLILTESPAVGLQASRAWSVKSV